jgi:hypothetical protein
MRWIESPTSTEMPGVTTAADGTARGALNTSIQARDVGIDKKRRLDMRRKGLGIHLINVEA